MKWETDYLYTDELKDLGIQTTIELTGGDGDINAHPLGLINFPTLLIYQMEMST